MKVMTVVGTRPEIIRLSIVIPLLDSVADHSLVHTGQNYDDRLGGLFFRELNVRPPDVHLGARGDSFGEQAGQILAGVERELRRRRPDRLLILGDTNSGLSAIVARRLGIPVYHMEAGNRCFDDRVPEEVNRRIIDHASSVLMPYTERSRENLLKEGFDSHRVLVTGNPIKQVIDQHARRIAASDALQQHGVESRKYILASMHRAENVDREDVLANLVTALETTGEQFDVPVICSFHPRTRNRIDKFGLRGAGKRLRFVDPLGFFDFVKLEQEAFCVISDSGTVQEEACLFQTPNVTIREVTERPETLECGSNILAGSDPERIRNSVAFVTSRSTGWLPPAEYLAPCVAETVVRIVTGYRPADRAEQEWQSGTRL
ncbi:MAG TPA: UDP-N-acetylglucosamine 2-epimerase (non-hydrolyzing) [Gemmatimonadaceae bacterium]|nr:UDP-N-acetylglucosamine 2-epimerase (non-hydrolyzing) [Gemmatimonadaceae bacterium]